MAMTMIIGVIGTRERKHLILVEIRPMITVVHFSAPMQIKRLN
ncbi:MAG: hypothetical protein AB8V67_02845 [Coxiella endosymbiont of Dermacentor nuttalli]